MNGKIQFSSDITGQTKIPANTNSSTRVLASTVMQEKEKKSYKDWKRKCNSQFTEYNQKISKLLINLLINQNWYTGLTPGNKVNLKISTAFL